MLHYWEQTLDYAGKACQEQTLQLIAKFVNYGRKKFYIIRTQVLHAAQENLCQKTLQRVFCNFSDEEVKQPRVFLPGKPYFRVRAIPCYTRVGSGLTQKCQTKLESFSRDKHSRSLSLFIGDKENRVFSTLTPGPNVIKRFSSVI